MADCLTTTEQATCPHCGQQMPGIINVDLVSNTVSANGRIIALSPAQAEVVEAIRRAHPRPATVPYIAECVGGTHGDEPSYNCVQVMICQIRPKLAPLGIDIVAIGRKTYCLQIGHPYDTTLFTEDDAKTVRSAIQILLKARKML